jgi:exosortase/archaeosortase family protein
MKQKRVFQITLAALAIMLMILPFVVSINDLLTRAVESLGWYRWVQETIVPWEVRMVGVVVQPLGVDFVAHPEGFTANGTYAKISWNCIGWQSLLLFLITIPFGFKGGDYTWLSKLEAFMIGILSVFLINLLRMVLTVLLLVVSRPIFALVFHDYLAAIMTIIFLVAFWWFAYAFVLEEREVRRKETKPRLLKLSKRTPQRQ